jgi:hypothetical protein
MGVIDPMVEFSAWCDSEDTDVGAHSLRVLTSKPTHISTARAAVAAAVPLHYASSEHIARVFARLGKSAAADFIREKLPTNKSIKSGDLGEILATEYIGDQTPYVVPVKKLRWKDHRNMAMRGEDVIGFSEDSNGRLKFLKSEAKSRAYLATAVLDDARIALDKDNGLPSAHALQFISQRLLELGNLGLADAIDDAQLKYGIAPRSVAHLLFTFSGNDPRAMLKDSLEAYQGRISQSSVGLHINRHGNFVEAVFDLVR